jgi:hypothetical protein|tara:strand:- start:90 stop:473 length:384 start_codon:yes stop_codon:yes gene_type:complete
MNKIIMVLACMWLVACANSASNSNPSLSNGATDNLPSFTVGYDAFSCDQLYSEARRITVQAKDIAGVRDEDAKMERLEFVGGVLYWPVLFLVDGSGDSKAGQAEYEQLKDRLLSLSDWMLTKECVRQ